MTSSGIDSQFGFSPETTHGTRVVPATFNEFVSEGIKNRVNRIISKGLKAGRRFQGRWRPGKSWVEGPVTIELAPQSTGKLFKWMFGAVSTSGSSPYAHTFTPGTLDDESLTIQFAKPDEGGTIRVFEYTGCQCTEWQLSLKIDEFAMLSFTVYGQKEDTSQTLASASYPSGWNPFTFLSGSMTIAGTEYLIDEITLTGNNGLQTGRHAIQGTNPARPRVSRESAKRTVGGQIAGDFFDLTAYNRFVAGTEAALVLTLSDGASASLVITGNARFDGETPNVTGAAMLKQPLPFVFTSLTSDAATITAVLTNTDSTP